MDTEKFKVIELDGRKFMLNKFTPLTAIKLGKIFAAKMLPGLKCFFGTKDVMLTAMKSAEKAEAKKTKDSKIPNEVLDKVIDSINIDDIFSSIQKCLTSLEDEDLEKTIRWSLSSCCEILPAGNAQVLNPDGTYGAMDI